MKVLFLIGNHGKISKERAFQSGNLICYILERIECRRKLKFGKDSFQICQIFLERKPCNKFFNLNGPLKAVNHPASYSGLQ